MVTDTKINDVDLSSMGLLINQKDDYTIESSLIEVPHKDIIKFVNLNENSSLKRDDDSVRFSNTNSIKYFNLNLNINCIIKTISQKHK